MSEASDIRSLLTSKSRAKVAPRDTSLGSKRSLGEPDESSISQNDLQTEPETNAQFQDLDRLQAELDNLPSVGKRLAIHLEQSVRADLVRLCDQNDITPETFIEAAFALVQSQPTLIGKIVADAKVRLTKRKRAGLVRRTLAMVQKYGS